MKSFPPEILFWLAAIRMPAISIKKFQHSLEFFPTMRDLFSASEKELSATGFSAKDIKHLKNPDWQSAEKDLQWCENHHCHIVVWKNDENYPALLREIHDAPLALFVRGKVDLLSKPQIAMVGSRNSSALGNETASSFAQQLAKSGLIITSGLALGIDAASHRGALLEGNTIAVMGAGLNHIYPSSHRQLAEKIISQGALVSEFCPYELPRPKNFPLRNRIISGLSVGVLVVEAALQSGSLITARVAAEQGREVFAIPGSIYHSLARGCHHLLRQGAKLVETPDDILEELGAFLDLFRPNERVDVDARKEQILSSIGFEATAMDTILARSGLTAGEVSSILLSLELEGYVQTTQGGYTRSTSKTA